MTELLDRPRDQVPAAGSSRVLVGVRLALLGAWLVVLAGTVLLAERPSTWGDLDRAVTAGGVDEVVVRGEGSLEGRGYTSADISWREGPFAHHTEVVVARPREAGLRQVRRGTFSEGARVTSQDVSTLLAGLDPGLRVERAVLDGGATFETFPGWQLRGWVVGVALAAFVATLFLLALGPETRRATRWAWFWLLLTPLAPVVAIALLVLGYPTRFVRPGHEGRRGLTGGWAFVVLLILGGLGSG